MPRLNPIEWESSKVARGTVGAILNRIGVSIQVSIGETAMSVVLSKEEAADFAQFLIEVIPTEKEKS